MSTFSFTAPTISDEQHRSEYAAFTEDEKQAVEDDLMGHETSFLVDTTPADLESALQLFEEALSTIAENDQKDYRHAMEVAPHLVKEESDPLVFLRLARFDAWKAAQCRVQYWKLRKELFGTEMAFLPLTSLPGGALNEEDRRVLQLGLMAFLPCDDAGRRIFFYDRVKMTRAVAERNTFLRVLFYMVHNAMQLEECQTKGVVVLVNFRGLDLYKHFDRIMSKKTSLIKDVMCGGIKAFHLFTGGRRSVLAIILPVLKQIFGKYSRHRGFVHFGTGREVIETCSDYGIQVSSLPIILGGSWDVQGNFIDWLAHQRQTEEERYRKNNHTYSND